MRPFVITFVGTLKDLAAKAKLEWLPAGMTPHPTTGKVDPCHPHLRLSPEHDAFICELGGGVAVVYPDSTMQGTAALLQSALKAHCTVQDVDKFLALAGAAIADKVAPYPMGKDGKPDHGKARALCVCVAGHDAVELCKPVAVEAEPVVVVRDLPR